MMPTPDVESIRSWMVQRNARSCSRPVCPVRHALRPFWVYHRTKIHAVNECVVCLKDVQNRCSEQKQKKHTEFVMWKTENCRIISYFLENFIKKIIYGELNLLNHCVKNILIELEIMFCNWDLSSLNMSYMCENMSTTSWQVLHQWLIDCFMAHQHIKAIAKKCC